MEHLNDLQSIVIIVEVIVCDFDDAGISMLGMR